MTPRCTESTTTATSHPWGLAAMVQAGCLQRGRHNPWQRQTPVDAAEHNAIDT